MKQFTRKLFAIALLFSVIRIHATDSVGKSFYLGHSAVVVGNGIVEGFNHCDNKQSDEFAAHFNVQINGGMNFKAQDMTKYLFFNSGTSMRFGQKASVTAATDVYNEYFLLPQSAAGAEDWAATLSANPRISNVTTDVRFVADLNNITEGLYLEANLPIVYTNWNLRLTETNISRTATQLAIGAINAAAAVTAPYTSVIAAFKGDLTGGDVQRRLYGNVNGPQDKVALGDARVALGYNLVRNEDGHFGVAVLGIFNSDNNSSSDASYLGAPVIGTAGRQCIGGRVEGAYLLYENGDNNLRFAGRADVAHAFNATITRSYDFIAKHGVGSRYMLAKQFTAAFAYNTVIAPLINISTISAKIDIGVLYDVSLALRYTHVNWFFDGGYQLSGHSKENHNGWVGSFTTSLYGAMVPNGVTDVNTLGTSLATNATISGATAADAIPTAAVAAATNVLVLTDLDINSGLAAAGMSHHIHGDVGYNFENDWNPYVLVGGGAEFSSDNNAPYQWEAHIIGGLTF